MNELTIRKNKNGLLYTDSLQVAEIVGRTHKNLLRDIKNYIRVLDGSELSVEDFFIKSTWTNGRNQTYPCYFITKKGCDMIANKITGDKGILFTAEYVNKFEKMENHIKAQDEKFGLPTTYKQALTQLLASVEENEKLRESIQELEPKANYVDVILQNKSLVNITQIAKDYGKSGKAFNELLHNFKIQYKQGDQWLLYSKYQAKSYTHSETIAITHKDEVTNIIMNTKWTQKGRLFLYEFLKKNNILPLIETEQEIIANGK